jgi:O-antigen ligase
VEVKHGVWNFALADACLPLILVLAAGQLKYRKPAWSTWHLALLLVFAAGSLVTAMQISALGRFALMNKDLGLVLLFFSYAAVTSATRDWRDVRRVLRILVVSAVLQNVAGVACFLAAYWFGVQTFVLYDGKRLAGMLLDPNAYGGFLVVTIAICEASSWGRAPLLTRSELWFARATLGLGLLFTFSRSAWASLGLVLLVLCAFRRQMAVRIAVVGAVAVPTLLLLKQTRFLSFVTHMAGRAEVGETRFQLFQHAWAQFADSSPVGGGLGSFVANNGTIAHNTAMWYLADFGIVGLTVLVGFMYWFVRRSLAAYRLAPEHEKPIVLALLLAHVGMMGLAMGIEASYQRHWWLTLALIASSYRVALGDARRRRRGSLYSFTIRPWNEPIKSGSYTS